MRLSALCAQSKLLTEGYFPRISSSFRQIESLCQLPGNCAHARLMQDAGFFGVGGDCAESGHIGSTIRCVPS
jgi:hypothetical protein